MTPFGRLLTLFTLVACIGIEASASDCSIYLSGPKHPLSDSYEMLRKVGGGAQGIVFQVKDRISNKHFSHKVWVNNGVPALAGIESMADLARQEVFVLGFMSEFFRSEGIPVSVVQIHSLHDSNPYGLTTGAEFEFDDGRETSDVGNSAPTTILDYIHGRDVLSVLKDASVDPLRRLELLRRIQAISQQFHEAIHRRYKDSVVTNFLMENEELLPGFDRPQTRIIPSNGVRLKNVSGSLASDRSLIFGLNWENVLIDEHGNLTLIDSF